MPVSPSLLQSPGAGPLSLPSAIQPGAACPYMHASVWACAAAPVENQRQQLARQQLSQNPQQSRIIVHKHSPSEFRPSVLLGAWALCLCADQHKEDLEWGHHPDFVQLQHMAIAYRNVCTRQRCILQQRLQ